MKLSEKLNNLMAERGLTQGDLARSLGLSRKTLNRWCADGFQLRNHNILNLAWALGVPANVLTDDSIDVPAKTKPAKTAAPRPQFARLGNTIVCLNDVAFCKYHYPDYAEINLRGDKRLTEQCRLSEFEAFAAHFTTTK